MANERDSRADSAGGLASADAFTSMGLDRQSALWGVAQLRDEVLPMFDEVEEEDDSQESLPDIALSTSVVYDYAATGLSLKAHPMSFAREQLQRRHICAAEELSDAVRSPHGRQVAVAGLVLVRQRPATAKGIVFITLEDETGIANLVVRANVYEQYYRPLRRTVTMVAWGKVERQGQVVHVLVERAAELSTVVCAPEPKSMSRDFH